MHIFETTVNHDSDTRIIVWDTKRRRLALLPTTESEDDMMDNIIIAMNDSPQLQSTSNLCTVTLTRG